MAYTRPARYETNAEGDQIRTSDGAKKIQGFHRGRQTGLPGFSGLDGYYALQNRSLPAYYDPSRTMPSADQVAGQAQATGRTIGPGGQLAPEGTRVFPRNTSAPMPTAQPMGRPPLQSASNTWRPPITMSEFGDALNANVQNAGQLPSAANSPEPFAAEHERNRLYRSGAFRVGPSTVTDTRLPGPGNATIQTSQGTYGPTRSLSSRYGTGSSSTMAMAPVADEAGVRRFNSPSFRGAMDDVRREHRRLNPTAEDIKQMSKAFRSMGRARA